MCVYILQCIVLHVIQISYFSPLTITSRTVRLLVTLYVKIFQSVTPGKPAVQSHAGNLLHSSGKVPYGGTGGCEKI